MRLLPFNRRGRLGWCCAIFLCAAAARPLPLAAETCSTQSQIAPATRDMLAARGRQLAGLILKGENDAVRSASVPDLAKNFAGVTEAIQTLRGSDNATLTVTAMFLFEATASGSGVEGATQFYCGVYNTPDHVTLTLAGLPPGRYSLVLLDATGIEYPRHLSFVLQDVTAPAPATEDSWKIAGFINRPMTFAGHDGVWYWKAAREFRRQHELWNASVDYELARQLVLPVGFLSSANSEKLTDEQQAALPADWPTAARPLTLTADGKQVEIASINPAFSGDEPMISVDTVASAPQPLPDAVLSSDGSAPAAAYVPPPAPAKGAPPAGLQVPATAVAAALLARVPEFKTAFQGIYIHAQGDTVTAVVPMKSL